MMIADAVNDAGIAFDTQECRKLCSDVPYRLRQ
jgi:hypothetical protein